MAQFDWHVLEIIYMNLENFKTLNLCFCGGKCQVH